MRSIKETLHTLRDQARWRRATLPWAELEAEAARQGCSPADVFFDRAGRPVPGLPSLRNAPTAPDVARGERQARAPGPRPRTFDRPNRTT